MKPIIIATAAWLSILSVAPALADDVKLGDLTIKQAWSRAMPGGAKVAGGYLTIENHGTAPDRLLSASTDAAARVELHEMAMTEGVMTMRPLDKGVAIAPGKTVSFAPGGYHLMLMDPKAPLKEGDKVPVTLTFENAGKAQVTLDVQGIGAKGPADAGHGAAMDHGGMTMDHNGMKK